MKPYPVQVASALTLVTVLASSAAVRFVDLNSANPTPPYTNWTTAATNIQDAVDVASAGDEIVVTNGVYASGGRAVLGTMTNRVAVDKALKVRSVNGPRFTVIQGYQIPGATNGDSAVRCVSLASGASLLGFTLTNGATRYVTEAWPYGQSSGGGAWCDRADGHDYIHGHKRHRRETVLLSRGCAGMR